MNKTFNKMGPHDVGGERAGPIDIVDHGMTHWEKHANALRMTVTGARLGTLDEMRRAAEDLGERYNQIGYFERQTEALAIILAEKGIVPSKELQREIENVKKRFNVPIIPLPEVHDHEGKPIQEDETGEGPNQHHCMNLAIQEILQNNGHITHNQIRQKLHTLCNQL